MTVGIRSHQHVQSVALQSWTINHNLGLKPISDVMVYDGGVLKKILPAKVTHVSDNTMLVEFSTARTGVARLIGY